MAKSKKQAPKQTEKQSEKEKQATRQWMALGVLAVIAAAGFVWWLVGVGGGGEIVDVRVPTLSAGAQQGAKAFAENCATCHGDNASGSNQGPPLIHAIYRPNHHADGAILRAMAQGVRTHHWSFGDMPAQRQVSREDTAAIVTYLREVQRANGIR